MRGEGVSLSRNQARQKCRKQNIFFPSYFSSAKQAYIPYNIQGGKKIHLYTSLKITLSLTLAVIFIPCIFYLHICCNVSIQRSDKNHFYLFHVDIYSNLLNTHSHFPINLLLVFIPKLQPYIYLIPKWLHKDS